ncbi:MULTISPECIES: restriction endonuclease [Bacillus]|uniref:restriction endonuclease n=1 Tax=Bacillus TaxID=1386 RepID=UPI000BB973F7|nr:MULTISPECIES: restriction endonuclease [Bacillus]
MEYLIIAILAGLLIYQWKSSKSLKEDHFNKELLLKDEFKRTIALGLYQRFCNEVEEKRYSSAFLKSNPLDFEHFIADVLKHKYGFDSFVTKSSGDFGVDIEHGIGDGKVIGQVKCERQDIDYEPIAIIHSNMIKQNASKAYVVSTSGFTNNAKIYAEGLNIDLIDGLELVEMWINYKSPIAKTIEYKPFKSESTDTISM